jgi:hypothetical protein
MKISAKNLLSLLLLSVFLLVACSSNDEKTPAKYDYQTIWKCHHNNTWDHEATKIKIVGQWNWKYIVCCGETSKPYENASEAKGVTVTFNENGTGTYISNGFIEDFTWEITAADGGLYQFGTSPFISRLHGRLLFCDNVMLCNGFYVDGADNFFEKVNFIK